MREFEYIKVYLQDINVCIEKGVNNWGAVMLYCYMASTLKNSKQGCYLGTNDYLSELFNVTIRAIQLWLKELEDHDLIERKLKYIGKNKSYRYIYLTEKR